MRLLLDTHCWLPIEQRHTLQVAGLPPHHKDPFDRILVAQAQVEDISSSPPIGSSRPTMSV
ncbi:hypothetical protein AB3662_39705 [Sorangium cellulosum]|uniref:hypothetical protein n=1 Tax=Sorangium cellulosum TaxID=56 RepID=UPI003D9A9B7C